LPKFSKIASLYKSHVHGIIGFCFFITTGDGRSNEQPGLATMHTIWMRHHNLLASGLAKVNPHWSDEEVYQNARRILSSQMQHVAFNEFLPRVLGWNAVNLYELNLLPDGYSDGKERFIDDKDYENEYGIFF
jgi:hypothetical protein